MTPIYISDPTSKTNPLLEAVPAPSAGTGMAEFWADRIVHVKPNEPYYYYIFAFNKLLQKLDVVPHGSERASVYVPDEIKADLDSGQCKILLDHSLEGFGADFFNIDNFVNFLQPYHGRTIFLTGDYKCSTSRFIDTRYANFWERTSLKNTNNEPTRAYRQQKLQQSTPARFKAICKNRLLRPHRVAIIKNIHDYELVDSINYSFGIVTEHGPADALNYIHEDYTNIVYDAARNFRHDPQKMLAWVTRHGEKNLYHERVNLSQNHASTINDDLFRAHLDSYFEIVVETEYRANTIFHSEKTFKAISWLQPFVLCAERYSVQALREMGYDVFDDIIDHSYDAIQDPYDRLHATFAEIKRLCSISDTKWLQLLQILRPRLIKNVKHLEQANQRYND